MKFNYSGLTANVTRIEREETPGGGVTRRTVPDGQLRGDVFVEIDEAALQMLARKALKARSRRAVVGKGLVICRASHIQHNK